MIRRVISIILLGCMLCSTVTFGNASSTEENYDLNIKTTSVGNYEFEIESHEIPSNEYLPIIGKEYFPYSTASFISEVENIKPDATYTSQEVVKVDVVFALGKLNNATAFQAYIPTFTTRLEGSANYIDAHVEQVETKGIDFSSEFTWDFVVNGNTYVASSGTFNGNKVEHGIDGSITASGNNLTFKGYGRSPIYDYASFPNDSSGKLTLEFTIQETNADWHTLSYSGFNFGCKRGYPKSGYYMAFNRNSIQVVGPGVSQTITKPSGNSFTLRAVVDYNGGAMQIILNGQEVFNESGLTFAGYDFGPFVQWGSHSCTSQSIVEFKGIKMEVDSSKGLGEAVQDVAWRDGAARFIIHATDSIPVEMQDGNDAMYAYTITKLLDSNCYLINLGNSSNIKYLDMILNDIMTSDLNVKGESYYNSPVATGMGEAINFIIETVEKLKKPSDWVLINTELLWNTYYTDTERDLPLNYGEHDGTQAQPHDTYDITLSTLYSKPLTHYYNSDKIQAEKWRYRHFPEFFDNDLGHASFDTVWIEDPVSIFDKTGKYRVNYKRMDNPIYTNTSLDDPFAVYRYWSTHYDKITRLEN